MPEVLDGPTPCPGIVLRDPHLHQTAAVNPPRDDVERTRPPEDRRHYQIVSAEENFDDVLVPADHVSRSYNDTYYADSETVLRCHTSAHKAELLRKGTHFLVIGDVYSRDSIDVTHHPVFHQMEGVRVFCPDDWGGIWNGCYIICRWGSQDMSRGFGKPLVRWLEVLGCWVAKQEILNRSGKTNNVAWAFGLGLERLAMVLFDIPDIRLFWSSDKRFTSQFLKGELGTNRRSSSHIQSVLHVYKI